jgi:hypothetical protein
MSETHTLEVLAQFTGLSVQMFVRHQRHGIIEHLREELRRRVQ